MVSDIPLATTFLVPNMVSGPTTKPGRPAGDQRRASTAPTSATRVYNGYAPATNPEALITPNYNSVLDPSLASASFGSPERGHGQERSWPGRGIKTPLSLTVKMVAGYTDYLSDLQIIQQELKPVGINLSIDQEAYTAFISDQDNGNFQFLIDSFGYTPDPWSYYYTLLDSAIAPADRQGGHGRQLRPLQEPAGGLAARQIAGTTDTSVQKPAFYKIEQHLQPEPAAHPAVGVAERDRVQRPLRRQHPDRVEPVRRPGRLHPARHRVDRRPARPGDQ